MGVYTHVTSSSGQTLALPVRDVLLRLGVSVLFGHTEVDDVNHIGSLRPWPSDQEVVRFNIAVDEVLLVYGLYS